MLTTHVVYDLPGRGAARLSTRPACLSGKPPSTRLGVVADPDAAAYDPNVKALCGLAPEDHIVAIVYLGTVTTPGPLVEAPLDIKRL